MVLERIYLKASSSGFAETTASLTKARLTILVCITLVYSTIGRQVGIWEGEITVFTPRSFKRVITQALPIQANTITGAVQRTGQRRTGWPIPPTGTLALAAHTLPVARALKPVGADRAESRGAIAGGPAPQVHPITILVARTLGAVNTIGSAREQALAVAAAIARRRSSVALTGGGGEAIIANASATYTLSVSRALAWTHRRWTVAIQSSACKTNTLRALTAAAAFRRLLIKLNVARHAVPALIARAGSVARAIAMPRAR